MVNNKESRTLQIAGLESLARLNLSEAAKHTHIKDQLVEILLEQWGDPDKLASTIIQDQEDREIVRNVTGTGVIF